MKTIRQYLNDRIIQVEGYVAAEKLSGNVVKLAAEQAAEAELRGMLSRMGKEILDSAAPPTPGMALNTKGVKPVAWDYRSFDRNQNKWGEWERVEQRGSETVESRLTDLQAYIREGYKYELRALFAAPIDGRAGATEASAEPTGGETPDPEHLKSAMDEYVDFLFIDQVVLDGQFTADELKALYLEMLRRAQQKEQK